MPHLAFPRVLHFLHGSLFLHAVIVRLGCKFVFKGDVFGKKKDRFHYLSFSLTDTNSSSDTLERLEGEEARASEGNSFDASQKIVTSAVE